jgi:hypothetical protein
MQRFIVRFLSKFYSNKSNAIRPLVLQKKKHPIRIDQFYCTQADRWAISSGGPRNRVRPGPKQALHKAIHYSTYCSWQYTVASLHFGQSPLRPRAWVHPAISDLLFLIKTCYLRTLEHRCHQVHLTLLSIFMVASPPFDKNTTSWFGPNLSRYIK